ncbi:spore coat protein [Bacillus sp. MYb209]|uniref:spore coat protein n=1 Tax=Bacillus sp. MYb209 TaxID=1848605 RepID=UPI000CFC7C30|nr:spore coat protein [Bacillus sp. MYb209]PQZ54941.1 spore coat protein [Bacillus sp. MYb209]
MSIISSDLLNRLVGESVRVNRGGPESQKGTVVAVYSDYFVLLSEKGTFYYYQFQHLKSITKNTKDVAEDVGELPVFLDGEDFQSLLQNLQYRWVKINRGGPEKIEGILQDVSSEYVTLIVKEEVIKIAHFHIKSVNYGLQVSKEEEEESNGTSNQSYRARAQRQSNRSR